MNTLAEKLLECIYLEQDRARQAKRDAETEDGRQYWQGYFEATKTFARTVTTVAKAGAA